MQDYALIFKKKRGAFIKITLEIKFFLSTAFDSQMIDSVEFKCFKIQNPITVF